MTPDAYQDAYQDAYPETASLSYSYVTQGTCACPICSGQADDGQTGQLVADGSGTVQVDEQGFLLDISNPENGLVGSTMPNGLRILSSIESAMQIARPASWASYDADLELTFSVSADGVAEGFAFDADYQAMTRQIFAFYAEVSGLRFREIEAGSAEAPNMKLYNIDQQGGGGWANLPGSGTQESGIGYPWTAGDVREGSYVYLTLIHEIGHLLGLNHPGNYNGSVDYLTQAVFWNDSKQYSVMSYMGEGTTGAYFAGSAATPMLFDILAIQLEYGINWTTRAGDTTYGFNSNSGVAAYSFTQSDNTSAFTIWDGAGTDTLDFSGFATGTVMDLRQGGFSSTGVETYNVAIAYHAVIENAVGGAGHDRMRGNEVGNLLQGGRGNDALYGGAETEAPGTPDPRAFTGIGLNQAVLERGQSLSISNLQSLSSPQLSLEMMLTLDRIPDSSAAILSYAVEGNANEFLLEAGSGGTLRLIIDGQARYDTPILTRSLADGQPHRLSLTWDSATGAIAVYLDGALAHQGTYTAAIGRTIATGGTLVIGQEQDGLGGGFQSDQYLPGTIGDIRIFNTLRSADDIAAHAFGTLAGDAAGLVHNWQVTMGDTTHVTDTATANPAINLTDLMPQAFTASQSSQYSSSHGAGNVLDNQTGTQNHTNAGPNEWLRLAFAEPMEVTHLQVQNITGWGSRLNGATVSVLDAQGNVLHTWAPISGEGYWGSNLTFRLPEPMQISALRIDHQNQFLHVAEINVFGHAPAGVEVPANLLNTDLSIQGGAGPVAVGAPILGAPDDDVLHGGLGDDSLYGGAGDDQLSGHGGDDAAFLAPIHGMHLNAGAVTSQYLGVSTYSGFPSTAGAVQFSVEMAFEARGTQPSEIVFLSYANSQTANALVLSGDRNGNLSLTFRGVEAVLDVPMARLLDGAAHRLSLTWDGLPATAGFAVYLDGVEVARGVHANQGLSLATGGTLIFGQDQDSIGGGFQSSQIFRGVLGDIRVFDHALDAADVAARAAAPLGGPVAGLVNNWTADPATVGSLADGFSWPVPIPLGPSLSIFGSPEVARMGGWDDDVLTGGLGNDTLSGDLGWDELFGGAGNDSLTGGAGSDILEGDDGSDWLSGDEAQDILNGGAGQDTLQGGAADDTLAGGDGNDTLDGGADHDSVDGGAGEDSLVGAAGDDNLAGGLGHDLLAGDDGHDSLDGGAGQDSLHGGAGADALSGGDGNDALDGGADADSLEGGEGDDTLGGGAGQDTLAGGLGDDTYHLSDVLDRIVEQVDAGFDRVFTAADVALTDAAQVEALYVEGATGRALTGNDRGIQFFGNLGADTLTGGSADDTLNGGAGDDLLRGGGGHDLFIVDSTLDRVIDAAGDGFDRINTTVSFTLDAEAEIERLAVSGTTGLALKGNGFATLVTGAGGHDTLQGGAGADTLWGWSGRDHLEGGDGRDDLAGGAGNDSLNGGTGQDTLKGGTGNDAYFVSDVLDQIVESAKGGFDRLYASVDFTLGDAMHIEALLANGPGGIALTGNIRANRITGNLGADTLSGGGGADTLIGGAGGDIYRADGGDSIVERQSQGFDRVESAASHQLSAHVEVLTLTGVANVHGTGNAMANALTGNAGNNVLNGALGRDALTGGAGQDAFVFNTALSTGNIDHITDFHAPADTIRLKAAIFTGLDLGRLDLAAFAANLTGTAKDAQDRILHDTDSGRLYFDADGIGGAARLHFATLGPGLSLTHADFLVV